jgi:tetratricopeptide (TPR) repeat protein
MGGNNFGHHHNRGFFNPFFGFPFFGFGYPFFGFGYGLYGLGYGYGYGYGYPYYYGYNPYAYYNGPYGYGYGNYAYPYSNPQTAPTQPATTGSDAEVFAQKGENDFKAGDYKSAVYAWRHALLDDAQNGVLTLMLAQGLFATGSFDEAAGAVQQGLQMLPEDQWGVVVSNFRELYGKVGDYTTQLRALEKAVKQQPDDPGARFLLGYHYGFLGYPQQAVKQLDKALELAPADQLAQKLRDQFNAKLPKPADANGKAPADKEAGGGQPNDRGNDSKVTTIAVPVR